MSTRYLLSGVWVALALSVGCGDEEKRDRSRGGPYDACEVEPRECSAETEGCAEVAVDYVEYRTEVHGFCSSGCEVDADCPADPGGLGGACLEIAEFTLCYERCDSDETCPPDFGCVDRLPDGMGGDSFFEPVCLPIR